MRFLRTVRDAVFERRQKDHSWVCITDNYVKAELVERGKSGVRTFENLSRKLLPVKIVDVQPAATLCEIAR